jgi:hypothetical protein
LYIRNGRFKNSFLDHLSATSIVFIACGYGKNTKMI